MTEQRRTGFTDEELETLAGKLALKLEPAGQCKLTEEQQRAVVDLITTKKRVVKWTLYFIGALVLWVVKDVYVYITNHTVWGWK